MVLVCKQRAERYEYKRGDAVMNTTSRRQWR